MAWIRTATSLITFGFSVYKFFQLEREGAGVMAGKHLVGPREFSLLMVGIGLFSLLVGVVEHRQNMRSLIAQYPDIQSTHAGVVAALIAILGVVAIIVVLFRK